jgi:hypothetical protein
LSNEVLNNKDNVLSMAQMLRWIDNLDIIVRAQTALDKANEAASNSCARISGLRTRLEFLNIDSEVGSVTGSRQPTRRDGRRDQEAGLPAS